MSPKISSASTIAENLKAIMRQIPYPVTVVTAATKIDKRGITIGSFTSLSLEPPLVSFNVSKECQMHDTLTEASHFAVHIPEADQERFCNRFAMPNQTSKEQFEGLGYFINKYGTPVLDDFVAVITCRKYNQVGAGDHSIIIGEVLETKRHKKDAAILYLDGSYHALRG